MICDQLLSVSDERVVDKLYRDDVGASGDVVAIRDVTVAPCFDLTQGRHAPLWCVGACGPSGVSVFASTPTLPLPT